ncbi:MAG: Zn-dependent protease [Bacteroidia bacterium]|nr:Zn-dependent protease [Bacteroidia bacterium]
MILVLQPLGDISKEKVKFTKTEIDSFYVFDSIIILAKKELPAMAWYEPRKRYVSDSLLVFLKTLKPANANYLLGLTDKDIATEKGDNPNYGIMGQGYCPGNSCVVSTFRLNKKALSKNIFWDRFSKVVLHELGHNFGLPHCEENDSCLMNDADGTIKQVDKERKYLCTECLKITSVHTR